MISDVPVRTVARIPFAIASLEAASRMIREHSRAPVVAADVHFLNAYSIALADRDPTLHRYLRESTCNFPDGKPLVALTRFTNTPLSQVRGPSLFEKVMDEGRADDLRHYLLGSTAGTLSALKSSLERRYPGIEIVGLMSPPFRDLTQDERLEQDSRIRSAAPDIVWVGLGTPKQDIEARRLARESGFFAIAVGAAFDFSAGTKAPSPGWMTRFGLEWMHRLASEPRRLWKRYLFGNTRFIWAVLRGRR